MFDKSRSLPLIFSLFIHVYWENMVMIVCHILYISCLKSLHTLSVTVRYKKKSVFDGDKPVHWFQIVVCIYCYPCTFYDSNTCKNIVTFILLFESSIICYELINFHPMFYSFYYAVTTLSEIMGRLSDHMFWSRPIIMVTILNENRFCLIYILL